MALMRLLASGCMIAMVMCASAHAGLDESDIAELRAAASRVNNSQEPYPSLADVAAREGPMALADALLSQEETELVELGLTLVAFHRLVMLAPTVGRIADKASGEVQLSAVQTLVLAGMPVESGLSAVTTRRAQALVLQYYGFLAPLMARGQGDRVLRSLEQFMADESQPLELRRVALTSLAGAPARQWSGQKYIIPVDRWLAWAARLAVGDREIAGGLTQYDAPEVEVELRRYLESNDAGARALAAYALAMACPISCAKCYESRL